MFANIVVLTYQAPNIQTYTYEIPKELEEKVKAGQLVAIPFGKREPMGIITDVNPSPSVIPAPSRGGSAFGGKAGIYSKKNWIPDQAKGSEFTEPVGDDKKGVQIKPISSIVLQQPILLPYQVELLKWVSFYYHAPMVNCLKAMLPEIPRRSLNVNSSSFGSSKTINHKPSTINQTLILVPTLNRLPETLAKYPEAKNYAVYHNELKTSEKFAAWLKILSGNADFIFGSRSAIFTPCPNLKKIVIFLEHDKAYKDERSPYYDTLTVAEKICELTGAKLQII